VKILIHPDVFYSGHSGAIAAREAARLLDQQGNEVGVYTYDDENKFVADYRYFKRIQYKGSANYLSHKYKENFKEVIKVFKPDFLFFIGGIINTPVAYLDLCVEHNIKTVFLLLVQDFYCARLHAGLGFTSCTLCLDGSNINAFKNNCGEKQSKPLLYLLNYQVNQYLFLKRMRKLNFVLGSTDQQLEFYKKIGIDENRIVKIPLFFSQKRVTPIQILPKPYFVIIGQYRHEKGIHLISSILDNINDGIHVILILFNQIEADKFLIDFPKNKKHLDSGKLKVLPGVTMTNGAVELIAESKGVINPSIWATTTEFVFLEVLGMSKPIICFDVGIHSETITNKLNGICVKSGDFVQMGKMINEINNNEELYHVISKGAGELYHTLTDDASFYPILNKVFSEIEQTTS